MPIFCALLKSPQAKNTKRPAFRGQLFWPSKCDRLFYPYDATGNQTAKTDFNGKTTSYAYDSMNRLLEKTPDASFNAQPVTFTYTATGQRATMSDPGGTTNYTYDNRDHLTIKARPEGTLNYTYDLQGNLVSMSSSNTNGASVTYGHDVLNRLYSVLDRNQPVNNTTFYFYDPVGNLGQVSYPNGIPAAYTYNALNRLTLMVINSAGIGSYAYTLGPAGNRLSVTEKGGRKVSYSYDGDYKLTRETVTGDGAGNNGTISYAYDPVGNRLGRTSTVGSIANQSLTYDANDRLTSDTYDNNGSTMGSGGKNYVYDFENHLLSSTAGGGVSYVYDGDGNRVSKTVNGVTTRYLMDDLNPTGYAQVLEELSGGSVQKVYVYGLSRISVAQAGVVSYYLYDGHGSVRLLMGTNGAVTDQYTYDAFGNMLNQTGTTGNDYLYSGEANDSTLKMYYLRARYLNQNSGRFWTMDSYEGDLQSPISLHKYLYTGNEPVNRLDRSGNDFDLISTTTALIIFGIFATMPNVAFAPVTDAATIEVHFNYINSVIGLPFYHAYLLVKHARLPVIIFRAGPSIDNNPNAQSDAIKDFLGLPISSPGFGYLTAAGSGQPFLPGTTDYPDPQNPGDDAASFQVPNISISYDQALIHFKVSALYIWDLQLQYRPVRQNSNSFVHTLLDKANLSAPGLPVWAPGWDNTLY